MFSTSNQLFTPPRLLQDGLDQNTIKTTAKFAYIFTLCPKNNVAGMFLLRQEFYVLTLVGAVLYRTSTERVQILLPCPNCPSVYSNVDI